MRTLLVILGVIALLLLLGGAVNSGTEVSFDYVAGSTAAVSLFWVALVAAAGLLLAGVAGWMVARTGDAGALRKLQKELEGTYRRLRACEAKLPKVAAPTAETATLVAPVVAEPATIVTPAPTEEATVATTGPADEATVAVTVPSEETTVATTAPSDEATVALDDADADSDAGEDAPSS